jgi:MATE family multidrug resistance protein
MRRIGFVSIALAAAVMGGFALIFVVAGQPIAHAFVASPAVVALTAQLLFIAALFQVADGVQVAAIAALRGLTDVRVPAMMAVTAYWLLAVPLAYALAFHAQQGAVGIWIGLATGLGAAAVGLSWRFHRRTRRELLPVFSRAANVSLAEAGK